MKKTLERCYVQRAACASKLYLHLLHMDKWDVGQVCNGRKQLAASVLGKFIMVKILDKLDSESNRREQ